MEQHWGWLIVIYLFLGGLGAGAYLTSYAADKGFFGNSSALNRVGYLIGAPVVAIGTLLLVFDLGQGLRKPWLLFGLLLNPRSVMTWGVYILAGFILVGLLVGYSAWKKRTIPKFLVNIGAVLALATGTYTGLLLAVVKAIPFWNTFLMPILFVVSALSTGLSATALLSHYLEKNAKSSEGQVCQVHFILVLVEIVLLAVFLGLMLSGANGQVAVASANMLVSGSFAIAFWIILVGLGLIFPLIVHGTMVYKLSKTGKIVRVESLRDEHAATAEPVYKLSPAILASDLGVILGGFVLRSLIILAALPIWNGTLG